MKMCEIRLHSNIELVAVDDDSDKMEDGDRMKPLQVEEMAKDLHSTICAMMLVNSSYFP